MSTVTYPVIACAPVRVLPDELPDAWAVWSAEPHGRVVLAFRPDVFDAERFPEPCLPTIYISPERDRRTLPADATTRRWRVELRLEPDVLLTDRCSTDWDGAVAAATDLARAFLAGEFNLRTPYHDPRGTYLDALEDLLDDSGGSPPEPERDV